MKNTTVDITLNSFEEVYDQILGVIDRGDLGESLLINITFNGKSQDEYHRSISSFKRTLEIAGYKINRSVEIDSKLFVSCKKILKKEAVGDRGLPVPLQNNVKIITNTKYIFNRIIVLKLDHKGDFLLAKDALLDLRINFPNADITGVFGSWNCVDAKSLNIFDHVVSFDYFGQGGGQKKTDYESLVELQNILKEQSYDLAVDLRVDPDTRFLLHGVDAAYKSGFFYPGQHMSLDFGLPMMNPTRFNKPRNELINFNDFTVKSGSIKKNRYTALLTALTPKNFIYGPYLTLDPGDYKLTIDYTFSGFGSISLELYSHSLGRAFSCSDLMESVNFFLDYPVQDFEIRMSYNGKFPSLLNIYSIKIEKYGLHTGPNQSELIICLSRLLHYKSQKYV